MRALTGPETFSINVFEGKRGALPLGLQVLRTYPVGSF
jgi:hypothetical protein